MNNKIKEYHYNIDLLRFILAVMIVYYHLLPILCNNFFDNNLLNVLSEKSRLIGRNAVDAFFILSGFFLYKSYLGKPHENTINFSLNRILRLWPTMFFSFFILLLFGKFNLYTDVLNIFFINSGLGITIKSSSNPATWFICVLLFLSVFFHYIMKNVKENHLLFICSILSMCGFNILAHAKSTHYASVALPSLQLTSGMVTGIACISLGVICSILFDKIDTANFVKLKNKISYGLLECFLFGYFLYSSIYYKPSYNMYIYWQLVFIILLLLFTLKKGFFSKFLNNKISKILGDFSYSIFVMHLPIITICKQYFWGQFTPEISALLTFISCIIFGILTHLFIEKKINRLIYQYNVNRVENPCGSRERE